MRKKLFVFVLFNFIVQTGITYSLEGVNKDYDKIYQVTVSIDELYGDLLLTESEKKSVEKVYKNYKKDIEKINKKDISFAKKQDLLNETTDKKNKKLRKILGDYKYNQLQSISEEIKEINLSNIDRKNEILDSMNLTNEQIYYILKYDKKFKRKVAKMLSDDSIEDKIGYYYKLRNDRDIEINSVLNDEQKVILEQLETGFEKK